MHILELLSRKAIVGHRGYPALELENTLASVKRAVQEGANIVEVDIQRTADKVLVLSHDENLKRAFGVDINIREHTWQELNRIKKDGYNLARLEEVLELLDGKVGLFIEVKHPEDTPLVMELLEDLNSTHWIAIISFHLEALEPARGKVTTGLVYSKPPGMIPQAKKAGCNIVLPKYPLATQKAIDLAHRLKLYVVAWTVNELQKALELFQRGVDGVATDNVGVIRNALPL
ncbi:MAG: glycerophosphodiester phosphodiesterase [Acidobacteria bacterium]|jgi:glycerophosphoryl diester phosphodiesterase|nr:MAG: glycerophosphodiester phosphodiesterase [Acidobacteriota bacterium]